MTRRARLQAAAAITAGALAVMLTDPANRRPIYKAVSIATGRAAELLRAVSLATGLAYVDLAYPAETAPELPPPG
jgi:hypothetical protein